MRSLLSGWTPAFVTALVAVELLACPRVAAPQSAGTGPVTKAGDAAAMRAVVQTASNGEIALDTRAIHRLEAAQRLLFDGRYLDAITALDAVLERDELRGVDTLSAWAHHAMAIAQAFAGHPAIARSHYDAALRAPTTPAFALADSIEAAVLTGRHSTAATLLDRFAESYRSVLARQYAHSFRALNLASGGACTAALAELGRAPDAGRPLPQAVRGLCAARTGRRAEAVSLRDSVLTHPLADPRSWPMIVARGVALKIH
jgi:hypothetical protein